MTLRNFIRDMNELVADDEYAGDFEVVDGSGQPIYNMFANEQNGTIVIGNCD